MYIAEEHGLHIELEGIISENVPLVVNLLVEVLAQVPSWDGHTDQFGLEVRWMAVYAVSCRASRPHASSVRLPKDMPFNTTSLSLNLGSERVLFRTGPVDRMRDRLIHLRCLSRCVIVAQAERRTQRENSTR